MPSVASAPNSVSPSRHHPAPAHHHGEPDPQSRTSPFAMLLDDSAPPDRPGPSQPQAKRTERTSGTESADRTARSDDDATDPSAAPRDQAAGANGANGEDTTAAAPGENAGGVAPVDVTIATEVAPEEPVVKTKTTDPANDADGEDCDPAATAPSTVDAAPGPAAPVAPPAADKTDAPAPQLAKDADPAAETPAIETETPAPLPGGGRRIAKGETGKPAGIQDAERKPDAPQTASDAGHDEPAPARDVDPLAAKNDKAAGKADGKAAGKPHAADGTPSLKLVTDTQKQIPGDDGNPGASKGGADAMQNVNVTTPAPQPPAGADRISQLNGPQPAQSPAVPLAGLAVEIASQAQAGKHRFEIRLDPPELGRIDVQLDIHRDGRVTSRLVADRAETLDLLKRDAGQLERALQQAGLKTSDNALEFSLRQQAFTRDDTGGGNAATLVVPDDDPAPVEPLRQGYGRLLGLGGGLDIRV